MTVYINASGYNYSHRLDGESISYSDGSDIERNLYEVIANTQDKSVLSDELAGKIVDWPTEYHFSRSRHCLLKHLPFSRGESVLELGCGCGAITRFLGETGADVDSVEGTHSRAKVAGERCLDLPNVSIFVDNLLRFESEKKYDWVLLIGVLEYAPLFSSGSNAVKQYLDVAKNYLKPNGKLVVAIENKLGLKYFSGCSEDHVNEPFFGIENKYSTNTPITFGQDELSDILTKAGFKGLDYFYPFPDYKLPNVVLSDLAVSDSSPALVDLIGRTRARDYSGRDLRTFDEAFVWPELGKNGLISKLSNSFLVVASPNYNDLNSSSIAWYYNVGRLSKYTTQTVFYKLHDDLKVKKLNLSPADEPSNDIYLQIELDEPYLTGNTLQTHVENTWHKTRDMGQVLELYVKWFEFVISISDLEDCPGVLNASLDGGYIDLTPFNIKPSGQSFELFDQEWVSTRRIPLLWVLFRGVYWSLHNFSTSDYFEADVIEVFNSIYDASTLEGHVASDELEKLVALESEFVRYSSGKPFQMQSKIVKHSSSLSALENDLALQRSDNEYLSQKIELLSAKAHELETNLIKYQKILPIRIIRYVRRMLKIA